MQILILALLMAYPSIGPPGYHLDAKPIVRPAVKALVSRGSQGQIFTVTAYTSHDKGMNGKGITASGLRAKRWHTVAASRGIPFGTRIYFPELGRTVVVQDRGGAIKGNKIDLYVGSRKEALNFGKQQLEGVILE